MKVRRLEIHVLPFSIDLKFDRHLGSVAAELPVKLQTDAIIMKPIPASRFDDKTPNLGSVAAELPVKLQTDTIIITHSRFEIWRQDAQPFSE